MVRLSMTLSDPEPHCKQTVPTAARPTYSSDDRLTVPAFGAHRRNGANHMLITYMHESTTASMSSSGASGSMPACDRALA